MAPSIGSGKAFVGFPFGTQSLWAGSIILHSLAPKTILVTFPGQARSRQGRKEGKSWYNKSDFISEPHGKGNPGHPNPSPWPSP